MSAPPASSPPVPTPPRDLHDRGTIDLTRTLVERLTALAKKEVQLAIVEAQEDLKKTRVAGELGGGATAALIAALACGLMAAVDGLSYFVPHWLAALGGLVVFGVGGALLARGALARLRSAKPRRSLREARATIRMLTERPA